jgi:hypothetical protein
MPSTAEFGTICAAWYSTAIQLGLSVLKCRWRRYADARTPETSPARRIVHRQIRFAPRRF